MAEISDVERIARDGSFILPQEARESRHLIGLALRLATRPGEMRGEVWYAALRAADRHAIIATIGALVGTGTTGANSSALRDSSRAMVEQKLTDWMIEKMDRLENASNRLAGVGIIVAVVIAVVQLWVVRQGVQLETVAIPHGTWGMPQAP